MARFWRKKSKPIAERVAEHHKEFAGRIIKQIKESVAPWQKPWKPGQRFLPANFKSGNPYRGSNTLNLASVAIERGYSDHRWGTWKQIKAAGGYVRKGERGTGITYLDYTRRKKRRDQDGNPVTDKDGKQLYDRVPSKSPVWKRYVVFNVEQTERLNLPELPDAKPSWKAHDDAERVIRAVGVDFKHERGDRAFYQPDNDRVLMPPREQFGDAGRYYRTALHEVAHATGHESRMDRQSLHDAVKSGHGSQSYAREELRAEISSMMTNTELGIGHDSRHGSAYVKSWVEVLEERPKEIVDAARDAQAMSAWMFEQERKITQKDQSQAKDPGTETRQPQIEYQKKGPERWEYRHGDRTATVTRPDSQDVTTEHHRRHTEQNHYLVTMEHRGHERTMTAWAKDSQRADQVAHQYAATGDVPTWSETHRTGGPRHSAAGETRSTPQKDHARDAGAKPRKPTIEYEKTGPDRFEYRQGQRSAVIEKIPGGDRHKLTMGERSNPDAHSVDCDNLAAAVRGARNYVTTGKTPEPTPERTRSPRPDRDDGPER